MAPQANIPGPPPLEQRPDPGFIDLSQQPHRGPPSFPPRFPEQGPVQPSRPMGPAPYSYSGPAFAQYPAPEPMGPPPQRVPMLREPSVASSRAASQYPESDAGRSVVMPSIEFDEREASVPPLAPWHPDAGIESAGRGQAQPFERPRPPGARGPAPFVGAAMRPPALFAPQPLSAGIASFGNPFLVPPRNDALTVPYNLEGLRGYTRSPTAMPQEQTQRDRNFIELARHNVCTYDPRSGEAVVASDRLMIVPPTIIRFSQASANFRSSDRINTLETTGQTALEDPSRIPPLEAVVMPDGRLTSLDNRRLAAAQLAGAQGINIRVHAYDDPMPTGTPEEQRRQQTLAWRDERGRRTVPTTWGQAINFRILNQTRRPEGEGFDRLVDAGSTPMPQLYGVPSGRQDAYREYVTPPMRRRRTGSQGSGSVHSSTGNSPVGGPMFDRPFPAGGSRRFVPDNLPPPELVMSPTLLPAELAPQGFDVPRRGGSSTRGGSAGFVSDRRHAHGSRQASGDRSASQRSIETPPSAAPLADIPSVGRRTGLNRQQLADHSRFMSKVLRHDPGRINLQLDREGWASIDELVARANANRSRRLAPFTVELLRDVVETSDKQRFAISADGSRIRANQGHSVQGVNLNLQPRVPPDRLWHGTSSGALNSIFASGINSGQRQHVHLSTDIDTARQVGRRHVRGNEQPVVLEVNARELHDRGQEFLLSANGVWLTKPIPLGAFKKID